MYLHLDVSNDFDFSFDSKLELAFTRILKEFNPDIIHLQVFYSVNALSILRACSGASAKKAITLHIHSLFCLSGTCYDKGKVCPLNSMEECSCESCKSAATKESLTLVNYNQLRKERLEEIISLVDTIICCSNWQRDTIQRLIGNKEKTVVLYHGVEWPPKDEFKSEVTRSEIEKVGMNWANFVNIIVKNTWGKKINTETIRFIENSNIDEDEINQALGGDLNKLLSILKQPIKEVPKETLLPSFGYLGTLWELKGLDVLLDAIKHLQNLNFQVVMGILFDPDNPKDIAEIEKLKTHIPQIKIIPNLARDDFYEKLFSQIDYLIIPSVWEETGPMTLFEAFYYKTPVIISNRPSMVEKTKKGINSLIFDNAQTLARIMKRIIETRDPLGVKTRANFPVKTSKEYADILESIYLGKPMPNDCSTFTLNIGALCNSDCIFCVRGVNDAINNVDFEILKAMLEKFSCQFTSLKITGGEPTLRKDLALILQTADQLGYKNIMIETNGRMFHHEKLAKLIVSYGTKIVTHLESYKAFVHDQVNRKKGSFFQVVSGIRNVLKHNGDLDVKIMIGKYNYRDLLMMSKFIAKLGVRRIIFVFIDPGGFADVNFNNIVPRYSDVRPYLKNALSWLMQNKSIKVILENFPFCCLEPEFYEFETQRLEKEPVKTLSYSPIVKKEKMYAPTIERLKRKEKSSDCRFCKLDDVCEGVYTRYVTEYGWQDFHPINP
ncbi:MAG: hypothetical protein A2Y03_09610 [Omnitrophica WOR_2 bacterium GWF2_38_59]|nr:MAG: hypothetical protein A2Y03_09610 [Omnitrophica WOR_2 bacterium GWF2_38_59]OGX49615.1 MAG: hypothetical protein A2243_11815 [Omnitrophica WOR_2 bacterium RIFOXYA2_FULL_38_17]OGX58897.1 MAG: hypothetical protein A2306_10915 [Omnitrophica WOR_2 bacterium RIFOXYB2_FULL_38_16]